MKREDMVLKLEFGKFRLGTQHTSKNFFIDYPCPDNPTCRYVVAYINATPDGADLLTCGTRPWNLESSQDVKDFFTFAHRSMLLIEQWVCPTLSY